MYKYFIKVDEKGRVLYGYSDAFFPYQEGDVLIGTGPDKPFILFGVVNPLMTTRNRIPLFKYDGRNIVSRSQSEIDADLAELPEPGPTRIDELEARVAYLSLKAGVNFGGDTNV